MIIPKKKNILGVDYIVKYVDQPSVEGDDDLPEATCDIKDKIIEIKKSLSQYRKKEVFLHECMHALLEEAGLSHLFEEQSEEVLVKQLEKFMSATFLRKNKKDE